MIRVRPGRQPLPEDVFECPDCGGEIARIRPGLLACESCLAGAPVLLHNVMSSFSEAFDRLSDAFVGRFRFGPDPDDARGQRVDAERPGRRPPNTQRIDVGNGASRGSRTRRFAASYEARRPWREPWPPPGNAGPSTNPEVDAEVDALQTLGLRADASEREIKKRRRELAMQIRADLANDPRATERQQAVNQATEFLLNRRKSR